MRLNTTQKCKSGDYATNHQCIIYIGSALSRSIAWIWALMKRMRSLIMIKQNICLCDREWIYAHLMIWCNFQKWFDYKSKNPNEIGWISQLCVFFLKTIEWLRNENGSILLLRYVNGLIFSATLHLALHAKIWWRYMTVNKFWRFFTSFNGQWNFVHFFMKPYLYRISFHRHSKWV